MKTTVSRALFAASALAFAGHACAQVTFYENEGFQGRSFTTQQRVASMDRSGLNDRASSVGRMEFLSARRWRSPARRRVRMRERTRRLF